MNKILTNFDNWANIYLEFSENYDDYIFVGNSGSSSNTLYGCYEEYCKKHNILIIDIICVDTLVISIQEYFFEKEQLIVHSRKDNGECIRQIKFKNK